MDKIKDKIYIKKKVIEKPKDIILFEEKVKDLELPQKKINDFVSKDANYWSSYNRAKCKEKSMFYLLLDELCSIIPEPAHIRGRKPIPIRDQLFCACLKVYSDYSARKISSDMKHAEEAGYIKVVPHFNSLLGFMNNPFTEELLKRIITISALPLKNLETDFAVDSSGFGSYQYERWQRVKWGNPTTRGWRNYVKCHITIGTKTNTITAVEVTTGNLSDHNQLPGLVKQTSSNFNAERYSCDKAYSSQKNLQLIASLEALPFVAFKKNSKEGEKKANIWNFMYNLSKEKPELFDRFYHRRSNVESTFSMIKMRLGEFLKSKNFQAQKNEVLLKCLVHNMCCLVQEIFENNIKVNFNLCATDYIAQE